MTGLPKGNSEFCFPRASPRGTLKVEELILLLYLSAKKSTIYENKLSLPQFQHIQPDQVQGKISSLCFLGTCS